MPEARCTFESPKTRIPARMMSTIRTPGRRRASFESLGIFGSAMTRRSMRRVSFAGAKRSAKGRRISTMRSAPMSPAAARIAICVRPGSGVKARTR